MNRKQILVLALVLISMHHMAYSQDKFGIGVSAIYNFQTEAFGVGARAEIGLVNRLAVVPQGLYFFQFNKVHEVFGAINLHCRLFYLGRFYGYLLAGGSANYWFNYSESHYNKAKPFNFIAQIGGGMAYGDGKFRPFAEYWYNPLWLEGSLHVGLMYYPEWGGRSKTNCPAYQ
jgi:hypothetical protein